MKQILILAAVFIFTLSSRAQPKTNELIKFETDVHDFGKIKKGVPVTFDFKFKNITNKPVVIESATVTCACTTPLKPKTPVMAYKKDKIKVRFDASLPGSFIKMITLKIAGAIDQKVIMIEGEVLTAQAYKEYIKAKQRR